MTTVEVLREARALIAAGWTRGKTHRKVFGRDCYCASGAIGAAQAKSATFFAASRALYLAIPDLDIPVCGSIVIWNDAQSSKRPVLAAFDRAIAAEETKVRP